jgi:hypothetical protein
MPPAFVNAVSVCSGCPSPEMPPRPDAESGQRHAGAPAALTAPPDGSITGTANTPGQLTAQPPGLDAVLGRGGGQPAEVCARQWPTCSQGAEADQRGVLPKLSCTGMLEFKYQSNPLVYQVYKSGLEILLHFSRLISLVKSQKHLLLS